MRRLRGTEFDEMPNGVCHIILLFLREGAPPVPEFVGELDFPRHDYSMPYTEYSLPDDAILRGMHPLHLDQMPASRRGATHNCCRCSEMRKVCGITQECVRHGVYTECANFRGGDPTVEVHCP
jgi:hypothetical protein